MLKTKQSTKAMYKRIHAAAYKKGWRKFDLHFEHRQWWVILLSGVIYSVCDAEGKSAIDGFDFEQVSNDVD